MFQTVGASAHPPNTGANEYNHAFYRNGGVATASGWSGTNTPAKAIDENENGTVTSWKSSTTTGWLAVAFPAKAYVDEVHAHFLTTKYPSLSLYLDTSGNGAYETSEKAWSTTSNPSLDVIMPTATSFALGMKLTIDAKVGNNKPIVAEFEAYLRTDTDGDGLTNDVESGTVYFYQSAAVGLPIGVPDTGSNNTTVTVNRLAGTPFRGLADFTVDHALKDQLSASLSYWDGGAWVETPVWDPGKWMTKPTILYPAGGALLSGVVQVRASVKQPSLLASVEFFVDGASKNTTTVPSGNDYLWSWNTAGYASGSHVLRARSHDVWGAYADAEVSVYVDSGPPVVSITASETIVCPQEVTISGTASDVSGLDRVTFLGVLHDLPGSTSWSGSQVVFVQQTTTYTITAVDVLANSASASVTVRVPQQCFPEGPGAPEAPGSSTAVRPGDGFFLSPGSVTITGGTGKSSLEAGYSVVGSSHRVIVNLTNPISSLTAAERSGRIAAPGLTPDVLNLNQVWRLTLTDWASGIQGSIIAFSIRIEEKTSLAARDTDSDLLPDGREARTLGTSPIAQDTDVDGLTDDYEVTGHSLTLWNAGSSSVVTGLTTDPTRWDTDSDGLADGQERGFVTTGQSKVIGEVGRVTGVTTTCTGSGVVRVFLRNRYTSPVVIAAPPTRADSAKGLVRVKAVTDHTFDVCFQEWQGDGVHTAEAVDYLVLEAGDHTLVDGTLVEAGTASVGTTFASVSFREPFGDAPVVLAQTQGFANTGTAEARIKDVSGSGFSAHLRTPSGSGVSEAIGYVAVSPQADPNALATWTRAAVGVPATPASGTIPFPKAFASTPRFLAWFATENSAADVGLRVSSLTNVSASYFRDATGTTVAETLAYFAFAQSMNLTARMTTRPNGTGSADTDGDGLGDGLEVSSYGSNPTLKDTDADGIADNVEVSPRTITIPVNGTSKTITFTTSPTSDDTDADGIKDPDELAGVLDHRTMFLDMQTLRTSSSLRDLSGNGGDGSVQGATCTSSVSGKVGFACSFSGGTARVQLSDSALLDLTSSFAITAWVYPTTTAQPGGAGIVAKGTGGGGETYAVDVAGGSFRAFFWKGGASYVAQGTTTIVANTWYLVTAVYDGPAGALRLYVNAGLPVERTGVPSSLATNDHVLTIGSRESSATSGYNLGFIGRIDEVQIWDRPLSAAEIKGYYNLTNGGSPVTWFDMETRAPSGDLFDLSGTGHVGVATGTTVVEGRSGFARKFAGGTDGILLSNSGTVSITSGVTLDAYVLVSAYPASDASLVARKGSFYLNLSSDGLVRWSLYKAGSATSPLPIPLNRWMRVTSTASTSTLTLYFDGTSVATGTASSFPSSANSITLGYTEGQAHLVGSIDQVLVLSLVATANTVKDIGMRGILLNPNATDTDFDGLADGQELFVKSVKTPKRTPIPDQRWTYSDAMTLPGGGPAWAVASAMLMTGMTHPDMGQVEARIVDSAPSPYGRNVVLRQYANAGQANNFTSYDLANLGVPRDELVNGGPWFAYVYDRTAGRTGQIEYAQIQLTIHMLPNRADTDADGLNDGEEVNLASDGFQTNPWLADTDGDTLLDNEYFTKGTSPVRADTDLDGVRDDVDRAPLGDAFVEVRIESANVLGSDDHNANGVPDPFAKATILGNATFTQRLYARSGSWYTIDPMSLNTYSGHRLAVNVLDDVATVSVTVQLWSYDRRGYNEHRSVAINNAQADVSCAGTNNCTLTYAVGNAGSSRTYTLSGPSGAGLYAASFVVILSTIVPNRIGTTLILPGDYSGAYNVTDASGSIVSRRYLGEPRFVGILLNATTWDNAFHCYCGPAVQKGFLVPRSVFFETRLYAYLNASNPIAPLNKLAFRQNGSSGANSDALQEILSGNVTMGDWLAILDLLTLNATNAAVRAALDLTNDLFLYSLPDDAVRILAYTSPLTAPSWAYTFCSGSCTPPPPKPWWEQLWNGFVSVVVGFVTSAVILGITAFAKLVEVLGQFGSWLADLTSGDPVRVARAVQAAATVVVQFVNWITDMAVKALETALQAILNGARFLLDATVGGIVDDLRSNFGTPGLSPAVAVSVAIRIQDLATWLSLIPIAIRAGELVLAVATLGVGTLVAKLISKTVAEFVVRTISLAAFSFAVSTLISEILDSVDWVEKSTTEFLKGLGFATGAIAAAGEIAFGVYKALNARALTHRTPVVRWFAVGLSMISLMFLTADFAYGLRGGVLFAMDVLSVTVAWGAMMIYFIESEKPEQKVVDLPSSIGTILEKIVVFGTIPLATATLITHAAESKYG